jgi:hypothetical protein
MSVVTHPDGHISLAIIQNETIENENVEPIENVEQVNYYKKYTINLIRTDIVFYAITSFYFGITILIFIFPLYFSYQRIYTKSYV